MILIILVITIITIIVLLILVGVTINLTLDKNGLFNTAKEAVNMQKVAEYKERIEISRATVALNNLGEVTIDKLIEQIYKDGITEQGKITKVSETEAEMITNEGYKFKVTLDRVEYICKDEEKPPVEEEIPSITVEIIGSTTHTAKEIQYSWDELEKIAETISNSYTKITNDTAEVTVNMNGKDDILVVGDTKKIDGRIVRILGFNHDELSDKNAYGDGKEHIYAGISFEYVDFITDELSCFTSYNKWGWEKSDVRAMLNGKLYDGIKDEVKYIKSVVKSYYTSYQFTNIGYTNDYLWLLSSSEILKDGKNTGWAGYTKSGEGKIYKYYKLVIDKPYNQTCIYLLKPSTVDKAELNIDEHT